MGYRLADGIVTYTPAMASELGLDRHEAKLYTNGARYVDIDRFSPRTPYEERDRVVGYVGRLDEEKGIRTLAEVAKRLPKDVTFVFAGDGELHDWLESELSEEIKSGTVEMTGWVDHENVPEVLSRLRLLVLSSHPTEGLPTIILESFACGTPVYATPVSGVPDVVREGETGFLMEDVDRDTIQAEIEEIIHRDDLNQISRNTRKLIQTEYTFEAAVERYRTILNEL
jgi:glycosyltransferase involved in cell wall biosynthesis